MRQFTINGGSHVQNMDNSFVPVPPSRT